MGPTRGWVPRWGAETGMWALPAGGRSVVPHGEEEEEAGAAPSHLIHRRCSRKRRGSTGFGPWSVFSARDSGLFIRVRLLRACWPAAAFVTRAYPFSSFYFHRQRPFITLFFPLHEAIVFSCVVVSLNRLIL